MGTRIVAWLAILLVVGLAGQARGELPQARAQLGNARLANLPVEESYLSKQMNPLTSNLRSYARDDRIPFVSSVRPLGPKSRNLAQITTVDERFEDMHAYFSGAFQIESVRLVIPASINASGNVPGLEELVDLQPEEVIERQKVQRTIERLYATGMFSNVEVVAKKTVSQKVAIVIYCRDREYFDRVAIVSNQAINEDILLQKANIARGRAEYYPEYVENIADRIREIYSREGYNQVRIKHRLVSDENGKTLQLQIDEGKPLLIRSFSVEGNAWFSSEEIQRILQIELGSILNFENLEQGLERLRDRYKAESLYQAKIGAVEYDETDLGAIVRLTVSAGPKISFRFEGNNAFSSKKLSSVLAYDSEEMFDQSMQGILEDRLTSWYKRQGFADVKIVSRQIVVEHGKYLFIQFMIHEGAPLRMVSLNFFGNKHFSSEFLRRRVEEVLQEAFYKEGGDSRNQGVELYTGKKEKNPPYYTDPLGVFWEPAYLQAISNILALYQADGYLDALVQKMEVDRNEKKREVNLRIYIQEGEQTTISKIVLENAPFAELKATIQLKEGKPYNSLEIEESRQAIIRELEKKGYLFAKVNDQVQFEPGRKLARVRFLVAAGPQVRVGRIFLPGLVRTDESMVRASLAVHEGDILDPETLAQSQRNLIRLGIFATVAPRIGMPNVPEPVKDVYFTLVERKTQSITIGGGYSIANGPRVFFEYSKLNLWGRALQFHALTKVNDTNFNYENFDSSLRKLGVIDSSDDEPLNFAKWLRGLVGSVNIGISYPRMLTLLPLQAGLRADLVLERVHRPSYDYSRPAAIIGTDLIGYREFSFSLQYEVEMIEMVNRQDDSAVTSIPTQSDRERQRFPDGICYFHSLRPTISYDRRDDPVNPRKGILLTGSSEFVRSLGGKTEYSKFVKLSGQVTGYIPSLGGSVFALTAKAGKIIHLDGKLETIIPHHFFMGGTYTLRGFAEGELIPEDDRELARKSISAGINPSSTGGELMVLGRSELRIPLSRQVDLALFLDAGNLWRSAANFKWRRFRYGGGAGIRWATPIGPAAFDLGFNLLRDRQLREPLAFPHFSIGL